MDRPISSVTSQEKSYYNEKKSEEFKSLAPPKPNLQSMQLNTNKAGMKGIDTLKINEIIQKASEGSKFFLHKQKCQEKIDAKIAQMKSLIDKFSEDQIEKAEHEMTVLSHELESNNDFARTIVHIDMDMFYAAVEMRDDPSLRDKPMAVGGMNMLSTSNYAARKFGVRAAMPGFIGKKLCPELIIVPTNFDKYKKVSAQIQEIFEEYDPNFSPMSLDEAYLDITNYLIHHSDEYQHEVEFGKSLAEVIVEEIRKKVQEKTQLTASAGIAVNTLLAKVCSDMNKPNGQFYLPPNKEDVDKFIGNLPIRKISGIGNVTEQQLKGIGIVTCSDLFKKRGLLKLLFSETSYLHFLRISLGIGSTEISPSSERERKSISTETTFSGTADKKVLLNLITELCNDLKADMIKRNLYGKVFTLKMKTSQFEVRTRAQSLFEPTQDESIMISVGHKLLINEMENETKNRPLTLRLLGVRMSNLCDKLDLDPMKQTTITELFSKSNVYNKESTKAKSNYEELFIENIDNYEEDATDELTCSETINATRPNPNDSDDIQLLQAITNTEPKTSELEKTFEEFTCPVCSNKSFSHMDDLNSHIDLCLNRDLVKELVKESNSNTPICKPNNCAEFSGSESKITPVNHSQKRKSNSRLTTPKRYKSDKQSGSSQTLHKYLGLK